MFNANKDRLHTALSVALSVPSSVQREMTLFLSSLCTEEGMLNATETAGCNLSEFYWCSKHYLFSCYL